MLKLVFVSVCALALLQLQQPIEAFKIVKVNVVQSAAPSASAAASSSMAAAAPATPAFSPNALLEGVSGAVSSKVNLLSSLLSTVATLKSNVKQGFLSAVTGKLNTVATLKRNVLSTATGALSGASSSFQKPAFFTKTVNIAYGPPATMAATDADVDAAPATTVTTATASKSAGYSYGK